MCSYEKAFKDLVMWINAQDETIAKAKRYGVKEGDYLIPGVDRAHKIVKKAIRDVARYYNLEDVGLNKEEDWFGYEDQSDEEYEHDIVRDVFI